MNTSGISLVFRAALIAALVLAFGCYRDNSSPFYHGSKNAVGKGGSNRATRTDTTATTTAVDYGGSSGNGGGYEKVGGAAGGGAAASPRTATSGAGTAPATATR